MGVIWLGVIRCEPEASVPVCIRAWDFCVYRNYMAARLDRVQPHMHIHVQSCALLMLLLLLGAFALSAFLTLLLLTLLLC